MIFANLKELQLVITVLSRSGKPANIGLILVFYAFQE